MAKFLEDNSILFTHQSGFSPKHSTESCLTHLCDRILEGCLIDLQKAFNTINHNILIEKLQFFNFSEGAIKWVDYYLANRTFIVNVETAFSDPADLKSGVPKGSILFLLYINDLPQAVQFCDIRLYADDTCISFKHKNVKPIDGKLNQDFN